MAVAGAGAGVEITEKVEPEPKLINFGSATLLIFLLHVCIGSSKFTAITAVSKLKTFPF